MKRIKMLAPLLLILLTVFSSYSLISGAAQKNSEFKQHIQKAHELSEQGIIVDAAKEYDDALEMKPSIDLYLEKGEMFKKNDMNGNAISLGELVLEKYPKESRSYDFLLECYLKNKDYEECYDLLDNAKKRNFSSDIINAAIKELRYKYELDYKGYDDVSVFGGGYCAVKKGELWGYVNESGKLSINYVFESAGVFSEDLAAVRDTEKNMYYIDTQGNRKKNINSSVKPDEAGSFSGELVAIKTGSDYAYYDDNFEKKSANYSFAGTYSEGIAAVSENGNWYLINEKGKKMNSQPYESVAMNENRVAFSGGVAFVEENGKYIMVDSKAERVGSQSFDEAKPFENGEMAAVRIGEKWGFADKDGNVIIEAKYDEARSFSNGLAAVREGETWGYINAENETAIEFAFTDCKDFNNHGCSFAKDGEEWVLIKLLEKNH